jgi:hypothetical protein
VSQELLEFGGVKSELRIRQDMTRAPAQVIDNAFLDPATAVPMINRLR